MEKAGQKATWQFIHAPFVLQGPTEFFMGIFRQRQMDDQKGLGEAPHITGKETLRWDVPATGMW